MSFLKIIPLPNQTYLQPKKSEAKPTITSQEEYQTPPFEKIVASPRSRGGLVKVGHRSPRTVARIVLSICANASGFNEAPPIKPPSIKGFSKSS